MQNSELMRLFSSEYAGYSFLGLFILIIGAVGAARLFVKCGQPWLAAVVPFWNVVVLCKVVGRPVSHAWLLLVPIFNVYFIFKLFIELAQSFGKTSWVDMCLCVYSMCSMCSILHSVTITNMEARSMAHLRHGAREPLLRLLNFSKTNTKKPISKGWVFFI